MKTQTITTTTATEAVTALATFIGQDQAKFFEGYFDNGNELTVYVHNETQTVMVLDKFGMNAYDTWEDTADCDKFVEAYGDGEVNFKKVVKRIADQKITIEA